MLAPRGRVLVSPVAMNFVGRSVSCREGGLRIESADREPIPRHNLPPRALSTQRVTRGQPWLLGCDAVIDVDDDEQKVFRIKSCYNKQSKSSMDESE